MNFTPITLPESRWKNFALNLTVWVIVGTLFTVQSYVYRIHAGQNITWWQLYPLELLFFVSCGMCAPLIVLACRKYPVTRKKWISRIIIHLGIAISGATIHRFFYELFTMNVRATPERPFSWEALQRNVIGFSDYGFLIYFIIMFVIHAIDYNRQMVNEQITTSTLKEQLVSAQLNALKMQLQPHFLFNTLNTISVLIQEDPVKAEKMVGVLSDLLRFTLKHNDEKEHTVQQEVEFLKQYLHIEQARFGDRLNVTYEVEPASLDAYIPTLILQPIVENAIKHGITQRRGTGQITVRAQISSGLLTLSVQDNGKGMLQKEQSASQEGIGLTNTVARLKTLYGDLGTINIKNLEETGAIVEIALPLHKQKVA